MRSIQFRLLVFGWVGLIALGGGSRSQAGDCNLNGIPDECDVDCGSAGGECDLPGCGQSSDINPMNGIPDECEGCPVGASFTSSVDFGQGFSINIDDSESDQLRRNEFPAPLEYLWVAASARGTVVKIDTENDQILAEYFSAPAGRLADPSRLAVDLDGNVWVGNRAEPDESGMGSVVKIGLVRGGTPVEEPCEPDNVLHLAPPYAYNTCMDRNGDGLITTSAGLLPLAWPNPDGIDDEGGVSSAEDECIIAYYRVSGGHIRHVAVDKDNNVWVGGHSGNNTFDLLDGQTGEILTAFDVGCGGYAGLVDCDGRLWSISRDPHVGRAFRYDTSEDIATCCEADMLADVNNDGVIDEEDEFAEGDSYLTFPVNSDDDNWNEISDFLDDGPVEGEDDLQEIQLTTSCTPEVQQDAWWSLSWDEPEPDTIRIWLHFDKSNGQGGPGSPVLEGVHQVWPPPSTVWLEALATFDEIEITFTVFDGQTRAQKSNAIKTKAPCTPSPVGRYWLSAFHSGNATGVAADITIHLPLSLCGPPNTNQNAWSNVHINVNDYDDQTQLRHWVQMGYVEARFAQTNPPTPFTLRGWYYEAVVGEDPQNPGNPQVRDVDVVAMPPPGVANFKVIMPSALFGTWRFYLDNVWVHDFTHPVWINNTGTECCFTSELMNMEDQMPGRPTWPCFFTDCRCSVNWSPGQPTNITSMRFRPANPGASQWGYQILSPTSFCIWDKFP